MAACGEACRFAASAGISGPAIPLSLIFRYLRCCAAGYRELFSRDLYKLSTKKARGPAMARRPSSSDRDAGVAELLEVERYVAPWILPGVCAGGNLSQPRQVVIPARSVEGDGFRPN